MRLRVVLDFVGSGILSRAIFSIGEKNGLTSDCGYFFVVGIGRITERRGEKEKNGNLWPAGSQEQDWNISKNYDNQPSARTAQAGSGNDITSSAVSTAGILKKVAEKFGGDLREV